MFYYGRLPSIVNETLREPGHQFGDTRKQKKRRLPFTLSRKEFLNDIKNLY